MRDLSVIIPARNEEFLVNTIDDVLKNIRADTEIIAVCDGYWPEPAIKDHPRVTVIHHTEPIGQRVSVNEGARLSNAKYIMKLDAHCAVGKGFDRILMTDCEPDWIVLPRMYTLHVFNWKCTKCGHEWYQGPTPVSCSKCSNTIEFERIILWKRNKKKRTDYMWFDTELRMAYFDKNYLSPYGDDALYLKKRYDHRRRDWAKGDITDVMCGVGACWFMERKWYEHIDGLDERHGSWGQMAVEIACKAWLSGGRHVLNKKTWFAHLFRTQGGDFSFPFPLSNGDVSRARRYSRKLWFGNKWPKAKRDLQWMIDHFSPLPGWGAIVKKKAKPKASKGIVYYTDNRCEERISRLVRHQIKQCVNGFPIVSVSQYPLDFGNKNIFVELPRSSTSIFKQIYLGLKNIDADIVYLCEHDVLYHPSHFEFTPERDDWFYYNTNRWQLCWKSGQALYRKTRCTSLLVSYKEPLLNYFEDMMAIINAGKYSRKRMGFAPGTHRFKGVRRCKVEDFQSKHPCVDIRHATNFTPNRWKKEQFRSNHATQGWTEADSIPYWGETKGRFDEFINDIIKREVGK